MIFCSNKIFDHCNVITIIIMSGMHDIYGKCEVMCVCVCVCVHTRARAESVCEVSVGVINFFNSYII